MYSLLSVLAFKAYKLDLPVTAVYYPDAMDENHTDYLSLIDFNKSYVYLQLNPTLYQSNLSAMSTATIDTSKLKFFPAFDVLATIPVNYTENFTDFSAMKEAINKIDVSEHPYIIGSLTEVVAAPTYYNYWVKAVANAFIPVIVLIVLTILYSSQFAQIAVQTKFVKKD